MPRSFISRQASARAQNRALISAIRKGNTKQFQELLQKCSVLDVDNLFDESGHPALWIACRLGRMDIAQQLLSKPYFADVEAGDSWGARPLHAASKHGHCDVVELLTQHSGAYIDATDNKGDTPLHEACRNGFVDVISFLVSKGAAINSVNDAGETPIFVACQQSQCKAVKWLLNKDANISLARDDGWAPLHVLCSGGQAELVQMFLDGNNKKVVADVNVTTDRGETPLFLACRSNHLALVELLLRLDSSHVDQSTVDGESALEVACRQRYFGVANLLIRHGAQVDTLLAKASAQGWTYAVEFLLRFVQLDACLQQTDKNALYLACLNGHQEVFSTLLQASRGAQPFKATTPKPKTTILHAASRSGNTDIIQLLWEQAQARLRSSNKLQRFVHQADRHGATALHEAVRHGRTEAIRKLIVQWGADPNHATGGPSPLYLACKKGHLGICRFLLEHDANPNWTRSSNGATVMHAACRNGNLQLVQMLLQAGANADSWMHQEARNTEFQHLSNDAKSARTVPSAHRSVSSRTQQRTCMAPTKTLSRRGSRRLFVGDCSISSINTDDLEDIKSVGSSQTKTTATANTIGSDSEMQQSESSLNSSTRSLSRKCMPPETAPETKRRGSKRSLVNQEDDNVLSPPAVITTATTTMNNSKRLAKPNSKKRPNTVSSCESSTLGAGSVAFRKPNSKSFSGTPLVVAGCNRHADVVRCLLEHGLSNTEEYLWNW